MAQGSEDDGKATTRLVARREPHGRVEVASRESRLCDPRRSAETTMLIILLVNDDKKLIKKKMKYFSSAHTTHTNRLRCGSLTSTGVEYYSKTDQISYPLYCIV